MAVCAGHSNRYSERLCGMTSMLASDSCSPSLRDESAPESPLTLSLFLKMELQISFFHPLRSAQQLRGAALWWAGFEDFPGRFLVIFY